jgi:hypothetical protein
MNRRLAWALAWILIATPALAQPGRRHYREGDWTSYVVERYIAGLAQGYEIIYIATSFGVGRYSSIERRFLPPLTASSGLDDPRILRIAFDIGTNTLWVETPVGTASHNEAIREWRTGGEFPAELARDDAAALQVTNLFTPWGLSYLPPDRSSPLGFFMDQSLRRFPMTAAMVDAVNSNRAWVSVWGYGLGEIDKSSSRVELHQDGPYQSAVQAMHHAKSAWYFGGRGDGGDPPVISVFGLDDSTWTYLRPFDAISANGDVTSITSFRDDVFFGTTTGLLRYRRDKESWREYTHFNGLPDDHITSLFLDGNLIWVGTKQGPGLFDPSVDTGHVAITLVTPAIGTSWVYTFEKAYGYIWAGTETGLYRIRQEEGTWSRISTLEGLLLGPVRGLQKRPEGIWCATDRGVVLLDSQLTAKAVYRSDAELTDGNLYGIAVDTANIWATSRSGVWRYQRAKDVWKLYTRADGLLDDFAYEVRLDGDYVWFVTDAGITRFLWNSPFRGD